METILVPTDFSPAANNATDYAVELAKFFNAKLILVTAYPIPSQNFDTMFPTLIIPEKVTYHPIRRISFACDMEKTEETALISIAKYFSKIFKAELEIVNIERPEEEVSYEKSRTSVFIEKKLEGTSHKIIYVTENNVAKGLEDYYDSHLSDIIIVSPKKHTFFHHLFKENITNELAFNEHIPILAIH
jgi:nucleotide-binding universal stress UspA family protein